MPAIPEVGGNDTSPIGSYSMPLVHYLTTIGTDANGYPTNKGYKLYGRSMGSEITEGIAAYADNTTNWATANTSAKTSLIGDVGAFTQTLRPRLKEGFAPSYDPIPGTQPMYPETFVDNVPTKQDQRTKLAELAAAAKSLLESPEIDESQNYQLAAGLSAAMGGGHNAVPAIKDNITFEQKLQAKQIAFATYAQALDAYYKTYTASALQVGQIVNPGSMQVAAGTPTVVPFESQMAGDIFANWQDTLNTGQMRDQQMRQTSAGANAMQSVFDMSTNWISTNNNGNGFSSELLIGITGIRSQYKAAYTY
jgi:hypothetical protein